MKKIVNSEDFPLTKTTAYINAANVSLMPLCSAKVTTDWQTDVAINGCNNFNDIAEDSAYDGLREEGAKLFSCKKEDIAGGSSYTELVSSIAWAIMPNKNENVVSTEIVFPSTAYPWIRVSHHTSCEIRLVKGTNGYTNFDDIIEQIDNNTAVVSISHVEYTGGQLYDLQRLSSIAHEHGALVVVDATQSAGAIPIDAPKCGADVIISGSYKWLCGPFGAAIMYLSPQLQKKLEPGFVGFRSHKDMWNLDPSRLEYPDSAKRFESSTMAFGCIKGLERSIKYLTDIGIDKIHDYNMALADKLIDGLTALNVNIASSLNQEERSSIVTCTIKNRDSMEIVNALKQRNIIAHKRQDFIRFSPHLYNSIEDIDRTIYELKDLLK